MLNIRFAASLAEQLGPIRRLMGYLYLDHNTCVHNKQTHKQYQSYTHTHMRQTIFLIKAHNKQTHKQYYSYTHTHMRQTIFLIQAHNKQTHKHTHTHKQTDKQYYSYTHRANKQTSNITHTRHTKAESMKKNHPFQEIINRPTDQKTDMRRYIEKLHFKKYTILT